MTRRPSSPVEEPVPPCSIRPMSSSTAATRLPRVVCGGLIRSLAGCPFSSGRQILGHVRADPQATSLADEVQLEVAHRLF